MAPTPAPNAQNGGIVIAAANTQDADWRKRAVLQNSYYTEVKNLIDQDELGDARDKLDAWAVEFPLSKLGGDYALAEAEYALKFDDYDRAQRILKAYRIRVDLSPQLAEAMQMEWDCDAKLQRPADIKELAADIKKRFPDLPLAKTRGASPQPALAMMTSSFSQIRARRAAVSSPAPSSPRERARWSTRSARPPRASAANIKSLLLYTPPDPSATGGLRLVSSLPLEFAFAIPESNQEHVYKAMLGPDQKQVSFANIPVSMYDLLLVTKDHFYEGISLNRDENSLSPEDLASIEEIFSRSVPFMNVKRTEAVKGTPGDDGRATALVQWMRIGGNLLNQNDDLMVGHTIRSLRLAFLADVGPGWQVTGTRELIRTDVFPAMIKGFLGVTYVDELERHPRHRFREGHRRGRSFRRRRRQRGVARALKPMKL